MTKEAGIYSGAKTVSSTSAVRKAGKLYVNKKKIEHFFQSYTKINSKCFKNINIKHKTIKFL